MCFENQRDWREWGLGGLRNPGGACRRGLVTKVSILKAGVLPQRFQQRNNWSELYFRRPLTATVWRVDRSDRPVTAMVLKRWCLLEVHFLRPYPRRPWLSRASKKAQDLYIEQVAQVTLMCLRVAL
jgi:hypothetical protein